VYDLSGRLVVTLLDGLKDGGQYDAHWDASAVASGIYFCRMTAASSAEPSRVFSGVRKMVVVR
jgi:hypothetical protein